MGVELGVQGVDVDVKACSHAHLYGGCNNSDHRMTVVTVAAPLFVLVCDARSEAQGGVRCCCCCCAALLALRISGWGSGGSNLVSDAQQPRLYVLQRPPTSSRLQC